MSKINFKNILNNIIFPWTAIFTAAVLLISLGSYTVSSGRGISVSNIFLLLLFSFIIALLNRVFYIKKLHTYIRLAIHFIFSSLSLYLILYIFIKNSIKNGNINLVLIYVILYLVVAVIYICINETKKFRKPKENKKQKPEEYQNIYDNK